MCLKNARQQIDRLPLTNDYVFKRVFGKKVNENILKDLLEAILDIKIEKVEVQNPEIPKEAIEDKLSVLDIKAELNKNTIVDIEMQVVDEKNIEERSVVYLSKNSSGQLQIGEQYTNLKKSIVINLLNFNYYKRNSYHHVSRMKFDKTKENEYVDMGYKDEEELATEKLEMHFIELPKFKKKNPGVENKIEQWLWTIIGEEGKIEMAKKDNKEVEKAIKIVDEMSMNKEERELYEARLKGEFNYNTAIHVAKKEGRKEGEELGKKAGKLEGKIEGRIEGKTEIAKKLLSKKMPIEEIAEITGLTEEKVKELKKESM